MTLLAQHSISHGGPSRCFWDTHKQSKMEMFTPCFVDSQHLVITDMLPLIMEVPFCCCGEQAPGSVASTHRGWSRSSSHRAHQPNDKFIQYRTRDAGEQSKETTSLAVAVSKEKSNNRPVTKY